MRFSPCAASSRGATTAEPTAIASGDQVLIDRGRLCDREPSTDRHGQVGAGAHQPGLVGGHDRIPSNASDRLAAIHGAERELERVAPGSASTEAIAERTGFSVRRVQALREAASVTASFDAPVGEDGSALGDLIADRQIFQSRKPAF